MAATSTEHETSNLCSLILALPFPEKLKLKDLLSQIIRHELIDDENKCMAELAINSGISLPDRQVSSSSACMTS
jgi:hypothetical protein